MMRLVPYPPEPKRFEGDDFTNTLEAGGYGSPTASTYDVAYRGYKPYGALGQEDRRDRAIVVDKKKCEDRYMIFTVMPKEDAPDLNQE